VSLIGVEPGKPGEPPAYEGRGLKHKRSKEAVIDRNVALRTGLQSWGFVHRQVDSRHRRRVLQPDRRRHQRQPAALPAALHFSCLTARGTGFAPGHRRLDREEILFNIAAVQVNNPAGLEPRPSNCKTGSKRWRPWIAKRPTKPRRVTPNSRAPCRPSRLYPADRRARPGRFFSDPDPAEGGADRHVEGHRGDDGHHRPRLCAADRLYHHAGGGYRRRRNPGPVPGSAAHGADRLYNRRLSPWPSFPCWSSARWGAGVAVRSIAVEPLTASPGILRSNTWHPF